MTQPKQTILTCIKNVSVLVVVVFSMVLHLFINASTDNSCPLHDPEVVTCQSSEHNNTNVVSKVSINNKGRHRKHALRINKRFQSESFIVPDNQFLPQHPAEIYAAQHTIGKPTAYLLFSVILAQSMRGPPVAA